ncbi:MAG: universal stress protein [Acidimicrobiia bacterium]
MPPVIVPLDGSARAESAIPYARAIAAGGPLTLVTTMWEHDGSKPRTYLEQQAGALSDVDVQTTVIYDRGAAEAILMVAEDHPGSIICMATHGRSGLGEEILGSVAEAVVRAAEPPVLLVGPNARSEPDPTAAVVVAVDTRQTAEAIAPAAAALAGSLSVGVRVIEVVAPAPVPFSPEVDTMGWPGDGTSAKAASAALVALGQPVESTVVRDLDPVHAILRFASDVPASFVVVGTHARKGLARVVLGSVAMRVVHGSPCPVLVVRS